MMKSPKPILPFVKLYSTVTSSSLWGEPLHVRIVFVSMLARCDEDGYYGASIVGLGRDAGLPFEVPGNRALVDEALAILIAPDVNSRSEENEGRRIEKVEGGWLVLNAPKYREMRTGKQIWEAERKAAQRAKAKGGDRGGTSGTCPSGGGGWSWQCSVATATRRRWRGR